MTIFYHESIIPARGHNIGVDWSNESNKIWTTFLLEVIPKMEKNEKLDDFIQK